MQKKYVQVEVLLLTDTTFVAGSLVFKEDTTGRVDGSKIDRLQEACWNGLVETMLPEVWIKPPNKGTLYLWEIKEAQSFLELTLSEIPLPVDRHSSINPHSFLPFQVYN
jgi:hypothetical protein